MNAWNSKSIRPTEDHFRITAGGAKYFKLAVVGGSGNYTLETSFDGGTTWIASSLVVASGAVGQHVVDPSSPELLSSLGRVTGTAGATIYYMQED
jgi:hypothetical protein